MIKKMSQQTSINDFYKSVHPKKIQSQINKKPETDSPLMKKRKVTKSKGRMMKENSLGATPSKLPEQFCYQTSNNSGDSAILGDNNDDLTTTLEREENNTHKLSHSFDIPTTPTRQERNNLKRTLSESRLSGNLSPKKKPQSNGTRAVTKHLKHRSPRKWFHEEVIDAGRVSDMIDNLNLSRAGVIPKNNFDLEKIYSTIDTKTNAIVNCDMADLPAAYDITRVVIPKEKHAEHLFFIISDIFHDATNCGYFNDKELDLVFDILTLSERTQMLFARMIKRKHGWKRSSSIEYKEIADDLGPYFEELERRGLVSADMTGETLETLLNLLSADDVRDICKQFNLARQPNKESAMKQLLKTCSIKPLFPGMEGPAAKLRRAVTNSLGYCVCIPEAVVGLIDRIVVLFIPSEDVSTKLPDLFLKLTMIKEGTVRYPEVAVQRYPIFQNRDHLIRYVESRNKWRQAMEMPRGNKENWETLITLARDANCRLRLLFGENSMRQQHVAVPHHVVKFREEYVCIKIVTNCLEVFKKDNETILEAVEMLRYLISQSTYLQSRKGEWYEELALIEMRHRKNLEGAALLIIEGLNLHNIPDAAKQVLTKRASTLVKRKSGLNNDTKSLLRNLLDKEIPRNPPTVSINANVMQGNHSGRKSTWTIDMGGGDKGYMSVEHRAKYYYQTNGYPDGWHCEGSLPLTLFNLLMWDELYSVFVPAAYLSAYQKAPLDLFTSEFYKNRKQHVDKRIEHMQAVSIDQLGEMTERSYEIRQHYECLMPTSLPPNIGGEELRDIVRCMGTNVVTGICKRLATNFCGWRAGFPDLFVWNSYTLECKFVEVKGPGDTLSAKQTLWLKYLEELGADTELCEVKASSKNQ